MRVFQTPSCRHISTYLVVRDVMIEIKVFNDVATSGRWWLTNSQWRRADSEIVLHFFGCLFSYNAGFMMYRETYYVFFSFWHAVVHFLGSSVLSSSRDLRI